MTKADADVAGSVRVAGPTVTTLPPATLPPTTVPPTSTSLLPEPTTVAPPATTIRPPLRAAATAPSPAPRPAPLRVAPRPAPPVPGTLDAYRGLGTWVDVYDWSVTYGKGEPAVGVADIDRMADVGVQTLYIQASKWDSPTDILEPERLLPMIDRAHQRGMAVVGWYLPTLEDLDTDLRRLVAIAELRIESVAVDIEARNVADVNERNRRLIELSAGLRRSLPGRPIAAIVLPPVVLEVVNPSYWPNFPYREIAPSYDMWMTMGYWSNRKADSGYRDPHRYTRENIDRLRANLGNPDAIVHPIGGLAADTSPADVDAFLRAAVESRAVGGSLYDWRTTRVETWPNQQGFRR